MSKIELNTATPQDLETIEGIDGERADYLVRWRPFRSWRDVEAIDGIEPALVRALREAACISGPAREAREDESTPRARRGVGE